MEIATANNSQKCSENSAIRFILQLLCLKSPFLGSHSIESAFRRCWSHMMQSDAFLRVEGLSKTFPGAAEPVFVIER